MAVTQATQDLHDVAAEMVGKQYDRNVRSHDFLEQERTEGVTHDDKRKAGAIESRQ
jgi:hypothetical protein